MVLFIQNLFLSNNVGDDFQRIAILSLDPGSDDQTIINLASGLTEDLSSLTSASKINSCNVERSSNRLRKFIFEINARYLIDGSIRQSGSNVRISTSLTDTKNQVKIWSEKFDKEFNAENFFNLQDEIVENVIDALIGNGAVLAQEAKNFSKTGTENLSAYECVNFVRGQYFKS